VNTGRRRSDIIRWLGPAIAMTVLLVGCGQNTASPFAKPEITTHVTTQSIASTAAPDLFTQRRLSLVQDLIDQWRISDPDVVRAMRTVPRHEFVPAEYLDQAYDNHPLPIGYGQTISQPYIVAWMTELLALQPGEKVLEIGTGSGYQAAILAELGTADVYSIEIVPELAEAAGRRLQELGNNKVHVKQGDGYYGWPEYAPFDAIIVTAAPDHVPGPLAAQLTEGGRMVIPIGPPGGYQSLWKFVNEGGELRATNMGEVIFVPLTGLGAQGEGAPPTSTP
jgi:protein-L-isoaspartate(D-aspartate) O-methyltransferase